ncbi:MAG: hypothetical protein K6E35_06290 [Bacteroidales bacterium]|nr:hypothetical protein [Bacteroidales bacterium]
MKNFIRTALLGTMAALLPAIALPAQDGIDFSVKGFVDSYHAVRTESPGDWMSSRTRVRGEFRLEKDGGGAFVSANLVYNALLGNMSGLQLREAYAYWGNNRWDIRAGKQIVTWGVADGLRVTDLISPMDYSEFLAQDYDDIRVPVGALRVRFLHDSWSLEAIAVPVSEFFKLPTDPSNPWSVGALPPEVRPDRTLKNMEFGGRFSCFLGGVDFSLMALRTWTKMPELQVDHIGYRRLTVLGGDVSVPFGNFVFRGEIADNISEGNLHQGNALVGLDWYPGADWNLSAQFNYTWQKTGSPTSLATLRISKALLNNSLTISTFAYADVRDFGVFNRFSVDWAATDQIHALVGYDYFYAEGGMFAMYAHNSEVWLKLKYSF